MRKIRSTEHLSKTSFNKKMIGGYFILIITLISLAVLLYTCSIIDNMLGFIGVWLILFEMILGLGAASQMDTQTTLTAMRAKGDTVKLGSTFFERRIKEEEQSNRKPWFIMLGVNTLLYLITAILLMSF